MITKRQQSVSPVVLATTKIATNKNRCVNFHVSGDQRLFLSISLIFKWLENSVCLNWKFTLPWFWKPKPNQTKHSQQKNNKITISKNCRAFLFIQSEDVFAHTHIHKTIAKSNFTGFSFPANEWFFAIYQFLGFSHISHKLQTHTPVSLDSTLWLEWFLFENVAIQNKFSHTHTHN